MFHLDYMYLKIKKQNYNIHILDTILDNALSRLNGCSCSLLINVFLMMCVPRGNQLNKMELCVFGKGIIHCRKSDQLPLSSKK